LSENTIEYLKRNLDAEEQSEKPIQLPGDFYLSVASYAQLLKRASGSDVSEVANRLIRRQLEMVESMIKKLLVTRFKKAATQKTIAQLLPEERFICSIEESYNRHLQAFIEAVASGQPSAVELVRRKELGRSTTIRFIKHVDMLVGPDLRKYGPFEPDDLASMPAASADLLVANGEAVEVRPRDGP